MIRPAFAAPFPIYLRLKNKRVLIVGGGSASTRTIYHLLESQARVTLVAPQIDPELKLLASQRKIRWIPGPWRPEFAESASLILSFSKAPSLDSKIAKSARAAGAWFYSQNSRSRGDFEIPLLLQYGKILWTIGGGEMLPGLFRHLLGRLRRSIGRDYALLLSEVSKLDSSAQSKESLPLEKTMLSRWLKLAKRRRRGELKAALSKWLGHSD